METIEATIKMIEECPYICAEEGGDMINAFKNISSALDTIISEIVVVVYPKIIPKRNIINWRNKKLYFPTTKKRLVRLKIEFPNLFYTYSDLENHIKNICEFYHILCSIGEGDISLICDTNFDKVYFDCFPHILELLKFLNNKLKNELATF